jgi:aminomethyltransferase
MSRQTPLFKVHEKYQGKMVDFAGYSLPIQYPAGIIEEHKHTRLKASIFDVSHMGQIFLKGPGAKDFLEKLTPSSYGTLSKGQMKYSVLTNIQGGIIDDLMITKVDDDFYYLVVNGAWFEADLNHFKPYINKDIILIPLKEYALIALQGPASESVLGAMDPSLKNLHFLEAKEASILDFKCWVSRSGYTGEDGFEISVHEKDAIKLVNALLQNECVKFAGLGARDSLRLEAGLPLYGHDLDESTSPIDAGLSFVISKEQQLNPTFLGAPIIIDQFHAGQKSKRIGLLPEGKLMVREGTKLLDKDHHEIGIVTSGSFSPNADRPISMGYVHDDDLTLGREVFALVRGVPRLCTLTSIPFFKPNYKRPNYKGKIS